MRCFEVHHRGARSGHPCSSNPNVWLGACVLALLIALGSWGCDSTVSVEEPTEAPVVVEVSSVKPELVRNTVALTGQFEAENHVVIKPEVSGVIETVEFDEGKAVEKGQILFLMRDGEQKARLREAQAGLKLAQDTFDRTERLAQRDVSSMARRAEAASRLDEARARLQLAQVELNRTRIRAPFAGVTGVRTTAMGDRVEEDDGLVSLAAIDRLQLVFTVQEMGVALARVGVPIHARVVPWPDERFPGEVFFVSPTIDPAARRLVIKAWVDNPLHKLKPGMFANVDVEIEQRENALMVPESSLVYDRNGTYVWRVSPEKRVEKVPVEIGLRQKGRVQIVAGISSGDSVISAGTNKVLAGDFVEPIEAVRPAHASGKTEAEIPGPVGDET